MAFQHCLEPKPSGRARDHSGTEIKGIPSLTSWRDDDVMECAGQMPQVYRDQDSGLQYVRTDGGHKVVVGEDKAGRVYFVDSNGNFYYDTGIPSLGFYMVRLQAHVTPRHGGICLQSP